MNKRKICVITGSRAEYGLLYWLIKGIDLDQDLDLQLIVTGMHLCDDFGLTFKEIERDFAKKFTVYVRERTRTCAYMRVCARTYACVCGRTRTEEAEVDIDIEVELGP